jgi:hypothetical protein
MNVALTLKRGGRAAIVSRDGDHVILASSAPSPPGSTVEATHEHVSVAVKVRGCRREENSADAELVFRIEGRLVSLTKDARIKLFGE